MIQALLRLLRPRPVVTEPAVELPSPDIPLPNGRLIRPPSSHVLMLDIDGVLHPAQSGTLLYLPMLEAWLRRHPVIDVVISSNWKDSHFFDDLAELFSEDVRGRVIGTTPTIEDADREQEILALVASYDIRRWVALDDKPEGFPTTAGQHLVATDYFDGLTPEHLARAARALGL
ncbi:hypothetical protein J1C51_22350 [Chromobacterium haemolyticum]|uniref:HAD domain-containing protein n=1 Tax=Chromobacterium haemolyticum TaxID=394935 RepID=UPI001A92F784|nr:HAD domain-containing protein [Chromobacterium haemolyticum]MBO0501516.1 hypothetical protein [Chromobacterium haemolyticum]